MCSICKLITHILQFFLFPPHRITHWLPKHLHKPCLYQFVQFSKLLFAKIHELFNFVQSLSNFVLL